MVRELNHLRILRREFCKGREGVAGKEGMRDRDLQTEDKKGDRGRETESVTLHPCISWCCSLMVSCGTLVAPISAV